MCRGRQGPCGCRRSCRDDPGPGGKDAEECPVILHPRTVHLGWHRPGKRPVLDEAENEAVRFIQNVSSNYPGQATVSYSGGKDSLATLLLVLKAIGRVPLLFADTGLEFPETYQNVGDVAARYGLELVCSDGEKRFWEGFALYGPPAVNRRWCCSACKLLPLHDAIEDDGESASRLSGSVATNHSGGKRAAGFLKTESSGTRSLLPPSRTGRLSMSGCIFSGKMPRIIHSMPSTSIESDAICVPQAIWQ